MSFSVAVVGDGVEVRESGIPGAGNGLWAARHFERNELITEYQGKLVDHEKALRLRKRGQHTHVRVLNSMHLYIDGLKQPETGRGGASFANDARDGDITNSMFIQKFDTKLGRDRVFLKALCDIKPGEEIFVSYGKTYWQNSKCGAQAHKQSAQQQPSKQQQQQHLRQVSNRKCKKPKQQQQRPWLGPLGQHLLLDEQSSQQSTDTVEQQLGAPFVGAYGGPPVLVTNRLLAPTFSRFAQVQAAAREAQSQLRILGQQRQQQQQQHQQQQQSIAQHHQHQQTAKRDSSHQQPAVVAAGCRRSARVQSMQQNVAAETAAAGSDTLEVSWAVKGLRSPVPVRRTRQDLLKARSSSPVAVAVETAAAAVPYVQGMFTKMLRSISGSLCQTA